MDDIVDSALLSGVWVAMSVLALCKVSGLGLGVLDGASLNCNLTCNNPLTMHGRLGVAGAFLPGGTIYPTNTELGPSKSKP